MNEETPGLTPVQAAEQDYDQALSEKKRVLSKVAGARVLRQADLITQDAFGEFLAASREATARVSATRNRLRELNENARAEITEAQETSS